MLALSPPTTLQHVANPILSPARSIDRLEREMDLLPHLECDRRLMVREVKRREVDARMIKTAAEAIGRLPGTDESLHMVISGRFALFNMLPAILDLAGQAARRVTIATLGFSRRNVDDLAGLIDAGRVERITMLCSHYFAGRSGGIYEHGKATFESRGDRAVFLSVRTHAKLLLIELMDGRTVTVESSELRSCKNIETMTLIGSPEVYAFHRSWILDLFTASAGQECAA